jgi:hypothetical protein
LGLCHHPEKTLPFGHKVIKAGFVPFQIVQELYLVQNQKAIPILHADPQVIEGRATESDKRPASLA